MEQVPDIPPDPQDRQLDPRDWTTLRLGIGLYVVQGVSVCMGSPGISPRFANASFGRLPDT